MNVDKEGNMCGVCFMTMVKIKHPTGIIGVSYSNTTVFRFVSFRSTVTSNIASKLCTILHTYIRGIQI